MKDLRLVDKQVCTCQCHASPPDISERGRTDVLAAAARSADSWLLIDRDWVIADCGEGLPGVCRGDIGENVWDLFPASAEQHFRPIYEKAWRNGQAAGLVYWNETISEVFAIVRQDVLHVSVLFLSVAGLRQTVDLLAAGLSHESGSERERVPGRHLRAV